MFPFANINCMLIQGVNEVIDGNKIKKLHIQAFVENSGRLCWWSAECDLVFCAPKANIFKILFCENITSQVKNKLL